MKPTPSRPQTPAQRAANAQRTRDFVRGVATEMRRVTWPTREEWIAATLLTIALVVAVGLFTSACDWIFAQVFSWLTGGTR
jgi:preprotein translocase SecE subunit